MGGSPHHPLLCPPTPDLWEQHPETTALAALQERGDTGGRGSAPPGEGSTSEEEEEECDSDEEEEPGEATPPTSTAPNPFALLGEDEC